MLAVRHPIPRHPAVGLLPNMSESSGTPGARTALGVLSLFYAENPQRLTTRFDAVAACSKSAGMIDMVFTDINLGGSVSGWDVAECFRRQRPDIPLLYMSGERIDHGRCAPGSVFVAKPLQHSDVLSVCQRLCCK